MLTLVRGTEGYARTPLCFTDAGGATEAMLPEYL
jgi:hypothetical protein